jgi:anti-sigma factor RsiW
MNDHLSPDLLVDYLHAELRPEDDALAYAHLQTCAACRDGYQIEVALGEALRASAASEAVEMPSLVAAAVWQQIRAARPGPVALLIGYLRPAIALPVAAALLLGGWFASPYARPASPTIDASYYFAAHAAQSATTPLSERNSAPALETSMLGDDSAPPLIGQLDTEVAAPGLLDAVR